MVGGLPAAHKLPEYERGGYAANRGAGRKLVDLPLFAAL